MCRNIRTLYNFDPPASEEEIRDAALQYVRKISGFHKPSRVNEEAFADAVDAVTVSAALGTGLPFWSATVICVRYWATR